MKVLHILSQIEMTGAEAYALTLSEWFIQQKHSVFIVSDKLHSPTQAKYIARPIHKPGFATHLQNILFLRQLIKDENIQIVHCHSRAAVRAGYWATRGLKVALVSTIHGRQHASFSKRLFDMYGDRVIGVCENVLSNLRTAFKMNARKMICLGNPVKMNLSLENKALADSKRIAVISRASGPKGQRTRDLIQFTFSELLATHPSLRIDIIGAALEAFDESTRQKVSELSKRYPGRLNFLGYINNLHERLTDYQIIMGSGRIPIESLHHKILTYAIGEYSCEGLITPKNYEEVKKSNFGDIGAETLEAPIDYSLISKELDTYLSQIPLNESERHELRENVRRDYAAETVCQEIFELYRSTYFRKCQPQHIPVLMYHKVPEHEIQAKHRIFITKDNFERHLQYFKSKGFTTISFKELEEFRLLQRDLNDFPKKPLILTFDDGYVDNLRNAGPLLKKYNMKATIFLLANPEVRSNFWDEESGDPEHPIMSLEEKKELLQYPFEIGSHGFKHDKITSMTVTEAFRELSESKKILQDQLGVSINTFAFTYGVTAPWAARLAQKAGYTFAVNTDTGGLHIEEDPYAIFRTSIFPEDGPSQLRKKTSPWYRRYFYMKRGR